MKKLSSLLLVASLSAATFASAQTSDSDAPRRSHRGGHPHGGPGGPGRGNPVVRAIDTDKNHELSAAELGNASAAIRTLDTDADGAVSSTELRPARPADAPPRPEPPADAPARPRPVDPVMLALDGNSDGALSAAEIANASASLAALDLNKDGKLTLDELRPLPPSRE